MLKPVGWGARETFLGQEDSPNSSAWAGRPGAVGGAGGQSLGGIGRGCGAVCCVQWELRLLCRESSGVCGGIPGELVLPGGGHWRTCPHLSLPSMARQLTPSRPPLPAPTVTSDVSTCAASRKGPVSPLQGRPPRGPWAASHPSGVPLLAPVAVLLPKQLPSCLEAHLRAWEPRVSRMLLAAAPQPARGSFWLRLALCETCGTL